MKTQKESEALAELVEVLRKVLKDVFAPRFRDEVPTTMAEYKAMKKELDAFNVHAELLNELVDAALDRIPDSIEHLNNDDDSWLDEELDELGLFKN